jgi:hypothetical protein
MSASLRAQFQRAQNMEDLRQKNTMLSNSLRLLQSEKADLTRRLAIPPRPNEALSGSSPRRVRSMAAAEPSLRGAGQEVK